MKLPMTARFAALIVAFGLCAALVPSAASATSVPANLTVNGSVTQDCTIAANTLNFAAYDPIGTNATHPVRPGSPLTIAITCTMGSSGVTVTAGLGGDGNDTACTTAGTTRAMKSGSNVLCYDLYTDTNYSVTWVASGAFGSPGVFSPTFTSGTSPDSGTAVNVYAQIPAGQNAVVGNNYQDTVVMDVNF